MKQGSPHVTFAVHFRKFLEVRDYHSPSDFHRELVLNMGKHAPSLSTVWMSFYGARILPLEALLFMRERYGFKINWRDTLPIKNLQGVTMKSNQLGLPGMRDLRK